MSDLLGSGNNVNIEGPLGEAIESGKVIYLCTVSYDVENEMLLVSPNAAIPRGEIEVLLSKLRHLPKVND